MMSLTELQRLIKSPWQVESTYRARVKGAEMGEILPESRKSPAKSTALKTGDAENAATLVRHKSEPKSPVKTLVKTPMKKEVKMTPKKEEVDIKCEEEEEKDKSKPAEASDHLVIFATEGDFLGLHMLIGAFF